MKTTNWKPNMPFLLGTGTSAVAPPGGTIDTDDGTGPVGPVTVIEVPEGGLTNNGGGSVTFEFEQRINGGQDKPNPRGTLGATETIDPADGNIFTGTLDQDCTLTLTAPVGSGGATLEGWITQDGTGGWDITFAATGGTVTDDGTITPDTTAGITVRYVLERIPGTTNDWIRNIVGGSGSGVTFGTPAIVLGTAAAAGSIDEAIRRDSTIVAFDATVPTTIAAGDTAATGSAAVAAHRDHRHGAPSSFGIVGILIADDHSTPLVFADLLQEEDGSDLLYLSA
jgi:hypothetical protein